MKLPFTICDSRFTIWKKSSESAVAGRCACAGGNRKSSIVNHQSRSGVALVITLILLSVTLIMAVAFLAVSRRERNSVTTEADTATARLAADSALANAQAQIIANVFAGGGTNGPNPYNFGLLVSTNYINSTGFIANSANPTNVNYQYANGSGLNSSADLLQNLANLFYSPRAPVFVPNLTNSSAPSDFRFYLDLNRNGVFDTNGIVGDLSRNGSGQIVFDGTSSFQVGDPEWIGVLERPDAPHGPNNQFVSRYAFIAMPVTLDLNAIYNEAVTRQANSSPTSGGNDGFLRNQGIGSWEINLAAFLTDLNTNQWNPTMDFYNYREPNFPNIGRGFEDAAGLLSYRYGFNYNSLATLQAVLGAQGYSAYANGVIDSYTAGLLMTNTQLPFLNVQLNTTPWAGADNTNHFFDLTADLFDPAKVPPAFTNSLSVAGNSLSTYDRYTFYRLLSQLGTDSTPESGKMNLNYDNLTTNGPPEGTNFNAQWTPIGFFTNAADRMLRLYTAEWYRSDPTNYLYHYYGIVPNINNFIDANGFGVTNVSAFGMTNQIPAFGLTNIPVWVNGQFVYSSAVNRLLQLAANIYDATTNNTLVMGNNYPSVFRPTFLRDTSGNVFINGYQQIVSVSGTSDVQLNQPIDVTGLLQGTSIVNYPNGVNVYGVPWIIGAKKGFPNFNEFSMMNVVQVTRKLQVTRNTTNNIPPARIYVTNQLYNFSISNSIGVECWNSYSNTYPNSVEVGMRENLSMLLTNGAPTARVQTNYSVFITTNVNIWQGSAPWDVNGHPNPSSFFIPFTNTVVFLPESAYEFGPADFVPLYLNPPFETNINLTMLPNFGLLTTNRLQLFMIDGSHIIDYVQLRGPDSYRNLNTELSNPDTMDLNGLWRTNLQGVVNQILLSRGLLSPNAVPSEDGGQWKAPPITGVITPPQDQAYFQALFMPNSVGSAPSMSPYGSATETNKSPGTQASYTPTRTMYQFITFQVNDPLVHYVASDLNYSGTSYGPNGSFETGTTNADHTEQLPQFPNIGWLNDNYQPWGKAHFYANADNNPINFAYRDSLVTNSDVWNFPTNKFPTVGWLGRVHRGTPWQTVYLKATNILALTGGTVPVGLVTWMDWTGNGNPFDATNAAPIKDRLLFDIFSTALNDNATRGQLSINVGAFNTNDFNTGLTVPANDRAAGLAAWSALFSGMVVPTTLTNTYNIINPAGVDTADSLLWQIVTNINYARAHISNVDGLTNTFEHVGDILAAPKLTEESRFILSTLNPQTEVSDELYEWLPQQAMSLLRVSTTPRYVIYSYGQTLKPAPNSVVTSVLSGGQFGMVTNYQIVSEIATRAVVRVNALVSTTSSGTVTNYSTTVEQFNILPPD